MLYVVTDATIRYQNRQKEEIKKLERQRIEIIREKTKIEEEKSKLNNQNTDLKNQNTELQKKLESKAREKVRIASSYKAAPANTADAIAYGQKRNAEFFGAEHWSALFQLWSNESGWRDTDFNTSSGACGIPQLINGCILGDHEGQIERGLVYIKSRYGTPTNALAFWNQRRWY